MTTIDEINAANRARHVIVGYAALAQFVRDDHDALIIVNYELADDEADPEESIRHFALSHTDKLANYMRVYCGFHCTDTHIDFRPDLLIAVETITSAITHEYDHIDDVEPDADTVKLWDVFGLGGDDDVDYNGSYINIIIELLRRWCDVNNIVHDRPA